MRKLFLFTAMFAMLAVSCQKNPEPNDGKTRLTIKLGSSSATRAVESVGLNEGLEIKDGHIFVINNAGSVVHSVELDIAKAVKGTGQKLVNSDNTPYRVSSDATVYVLGNIPASVEVDELTSWNAIKTATSTIFYDRDGNETDTSTNTKYLEAALANDTGEGAPIKVVDGEGTVEIGLAPLYSRLEIVKVSSTGNLKSFRVAGVYLDNYYNTFTMNGTILKDAKPWEQKQSTDFTGNIGDTYGADEGKSTLNNSVNSFSPGDNKVWAFHIPAAGTPKIIVHLTDVKYEESGQEPITLTGDQYLTITGYDGVDDKGFAPGQIYRINNLQFSQSMIGPTPNPADVELTVKVSVIQWKINLINQNNL